MLICYALNSLLRAWVLYISSFTFGSKTQGLWVNSSLWVFCLRWRFRIQVLTFFCKEWKINLSGGYWQLLLNIFGCRRGAIIKHRNITEATFFFAENHHQERTEYLVVIHRIYLKTWFVFWDLQDPVIKETDTDKNCIPPPLLHQFDDYKK